MPSITLSLTETEHLALEYAAVSTTDWINNAVKERCRLAIEEIVAITVKNCLNSGMPIPGTREEIVDLAFQKGWVIKLKDTPKPEL
jgi:hypothetical protein